MGIGDVRGQRGYTGDMLQNDAFGRVDVSKEHEEAFRIMKDKYGFLSLDKLLDLVRRYTREDPTNPKKPFARELRQAVIEQLGIETVEDMDRVKFYSAVGTHADILEGVDAWIEYTDDDAGRVVVTLDITKNPNKDSWKADVIIPEVADESDEDGLVEDAEKFGEMVVEKLQKKISDIDARKQ
ncbi:hypothetical protein HYV69_00455 [Candidatus Uhrbacteria bacterium]|nr:hypothetical protein [Candidatus Uhrbacteria bacterium]